MSFKPKPHVVDILLSRLRILSSLNDGRVDLSRNLPERSSKTLFREGLGW
jgi:hypothetical protein